MTVYRYPLRPPVPTSQGNYDANAPTEATDYIMLRRNRIQYSDGEARYYGENLPNNNIDRVLNPDVCYIAMPSQLATSYSPAYRQVDVGVAGVMAAQMVATGGDFTSMDSLATAISGAANASLPEFAMSTLAQAANGMNGLLGLQGNVDSNSLLAISRGKVFNPFTEQVFSNMSFRTHQFQFKMLSRSMEEAREIKRIISYIKGGAVPIIGGSQADDISGQISGGQGTSESASVASRNRFMEVPDKFNIKFVRMSPDGTLSEDSDGFGSMHFKIHTSVCTGVQVNYTPDGQYSSFKNITGEMVQVPAIQLSLSFTETRMISQGDIARGF